MLMLILAQLALDGLWEGALCCSGLDRRGGCISRVGGRRGGRQSRRGGQGRGGRHSRGGGRGRGGRQSIIVFRIIRVQLLN